MKKLIYQIWLDGDLGELWLDEHLNLLQYLHYDEGDINSNHDFIFKYLGVEKIRIEINPTEEKFEKICSGLGGKQILKLLKDEILEKINEN